jgi:hypothetical protein
MVLTVSFELSPVTGLFCHRRFAEDSTKLDASVGASGPHDFAVRESLFEKAARRTWYRSRRSFNEGRSAPLVSRRRRVHRIPHPTSVTIAKRPSEWDGMGIDMDSIWVMREAKYFCAKDWTGSISLIRFDKFAVRRNSSTLISVAIFSSPSFRGDAKHRTRNLEIPGR